MTETFYDLLGVTPDATTEEIETAYRDAIKTVHPDLNDGGDASERTARLNKAKDVLTDEDERARYDRLGHESYTDGTGATAAGSADRSGAATGTDTDPFRSETRTRSRTAAHGRRSGPGSRRDTGRSGRSDGGSTAGDRRGSGRGGWNGQSPSARRQAAASTTPGPNVEGSWNAWGRTRAWAVHRDTGARRGVHPRRFLPEEASMLLLASTFALYPFFVLSALVPMFPLFARLLVAACTLLTVVYLLSIPEAAIGVFGLWSLIVPLVLLVLPGVGLFSLVGVVALLSTWLPFGFAVLTYTALRPV